MQLHVRTIVVAASILGVPAIAMRPLATEFQCPGVNHSITTAAEAKPTSTRYRVRAR